MTGDGDELAAVLRPRFGAAAAEQAPPPRLYELRRIARAQHDAMVHDLAGEHPGMTIETCLYGEVLVTRTGGRVLATGYVARIEPHGERTVLHFGDELLPPWSAVVPEHLAGDVTQWARVSVVGVEVGDRHIVDDVHIGSCLDDAPSDGPFVT